MQKEEVVISFLEKTFGYAVSGYGEYKEFKGYHCWKDAKKYAKRLEYLYAEDRYDEEGEEE